MMNDKKKHALIVDDEPAIRELLEITLGRMGLSTDSSEDLASARSSLQKNDYDLCLTDMRLPDGNGISLVEYIQTNFPELPVAVITAHGNVDLAVKALKAGAFDFVSKPVDLNDLRALVNTALKLESNKSGATPEKSLEDKLIGKSRPMQVLRKTIHKLSRRQAPVLIGGESGTGKELIARLIHEQGPRAEKSFVAVNCGAIPSELMESEFFGHVKGSFTGANENKMGLFQAAHEGTLFLDEVAELPLGMQVKLLRSLQERSIRPVGGAQEIDVDVRILSASHRNLGEMVARGEFRQDLYYRLNVICIESPPLRERGDDIIVLAKYLLKRLSDRQSMACPGISGQAMKALKAYNYPGNVRELENILERGLALLDTELIQVEDLQLPHAVRLQETPATAESLDMMLERVEREAIMHALDNNRWNKTEAARSLGISFRSLRYRLQKLKID